ncbi:hypothetical protein GCM10007907_08940 [Chitinimonas prasina]|uniref:DUF2199 domain-containing protein n=1 Tax=Chitinimonas prasina TaxID=1434937 RepID=A0ABQ5YGQ4_9NEIS|nr:hypothetical protein [Chitinimonas prasina]GLR12104.1 hypothetical protein GCM10007907_08940 [Chitinimonas prasina]
MDETIDLWNVEGNVHLTLRVAGYQFPDSPDEDWLLIDLTVHHDDQCFGRIDPAIEVNELLDLRNWFHDLQHRRLPKYATVDFTEPCFTFHFLRSDPAHVRIGVELDAELKPPFPLHQFGFEAQTWQIIFNLSNEQLCTIVAVLDQSLSQYPARGAG